MTKAVRIENADTSAYKVRVRIFDRKGDLPDPKNDTLVREQILEHASAMTDSSTYIHSSRYIVVDEA